MLDLHTGPGVRHEDRSRLNFTIKKVEGESEHSRSCAMFLAKPIRILAAASLILFLFLVYQVFRSSSQRNGPGHLEKEMPNEPLLQGESTCALETPKLRMCRNQRTSRTPLAGGRLCRG